MSWLVQFTANGRSEAEEHNTLDSAKVAFKRGKKLFLNLAEITPDLTVSGSITEFNKNEQKIVAFFDSNSSLVRS